MENDLKITAGRVYHCPVCGAEVTVVLHRSGKLAPVCCNLPMVLVSVISPIYYCPTCGAEITVTKRGPGELAPRCCNRDMIKKAAA